MALSDDPPTAPAVASPQLVQAQCTFYGFPDNCPPSAATAYEIVHSLAGGTGTWADPITYAGFAAFTPPGTMIYVPQLRKYFVMEDDCQVGLSAPHLDSERSFGEALLPCISNSVRVPQALLCLQECGRDYTLKGSYHFDLWLGPSSLCDSSALIACEVALTLTNTTVEINAAPGHPVDPTVLFDGASNTCAVPSSPCVDTTSTCGNLCEIPEAATCQELAQIFGLTYSRFLQLNSGLACSALPLPADTTVCQGGLCGN